MNKRQDKWGGGGSKKPLKEPFPNTRTRNLTISFDHGYRLDFLRGGARKFIYKLRFRLKVIW
jgi:hypothetical protein